MGRHSHSQARTLYKRTKKITGYGLWVAGSVWANGESFEWFARRDAKYAEGQ
jgi:hypothetical protein